VSNPEKEIVEHKVRRAVGIRALRKMGRIVADERRDDEDKARAVRWFLHYGWLVALGVVLAWAYWAGVI
jgi:hypothetical protein